jgi:hypothetical protein
MQEKARKEVINILGDGNDIVYPTAAQCTEMKYLYMIIKEVMPLKNPCTESPSKPISHTTLST